MIRFVKLTIAVLVISTLFIMTGTSYAMYDQNDITTEDIYVPTNINYKDVDENHWAYETISDLTNRDIIHGYENGYFNPDELITRAELAKILVNMANLPINRSEKSSYADVDASSELSQYIETVYPYLSKWKNVETGELLFMPDNNVRRGDIIFSLLKMIGADTSNVNLEFFNEIITDSDTINEAQKPYLAYAIEKGYITGFSDNSIKANEYMTRAQLCVLLDRIFNEPIDDYVENYNVIDYIPPKPEPVPEQPTYSYSNED